MKSPIVKTCFTILFSFFIIYSPAQTSWNLGGNSSSNPSENIGSSSMTDLKFITDNQFRMNLTKTGRLGLNTNDPNAFFEVEYCLPAAANNGGFLVTRTLCPSGYTPVFFDPNVDYEIIGFPFDGLIPIESGSNQIKVPFSYLTGHTTNLSTPLSRAEGPLIWARTKGTTGWSLGTANDLNTKFIVMPDGSCGINISQPRAALDIRGSQYYNHPAAIIGSLASGSYAINPLNNLPQYYTQQVQFVPNLTAFGFNRISQLYDQGMFFSDGKGTEGSNLNGAFILAPWSQEADTAIVGGMRMDKYGNTEFHGTLRATQLHIDAKWWSDFVFAEDYKLMKLADLEDYIIANNHLPNVPSEAEVLQNGMDVANMQAIQQQKIEELTLYIIQLKKEIDMMKEKIESLKQ